MSSEQADVRDRHARTPDACLLRVRAGEVVVAFLALLRPVRGGARRSGSEVTGVH